MAKTTFNHVRISGITAVVPEHFINIDDELELFHNDIKLLERNKKILGLGKRHVADERTTNADLCEAAARSLITQMALDKSSIDTLIVASTSHDYHYPASACIVQGRLGLEEDCTCFDLSGLACSVYVHGLWLTHSLIASGAAKKCLLLVGDIASTHSDPRNRNSHMLFGDAAVATFLEETEEECPAFFLTGTRGKDWDKLIAPAGGYNLPMRSDIANLEIADRSGNVWRLCDDIMKGMDIFRFSTEVGPKGVTEILQFAGITQNEVDYFAFHQANGQIVRSVAQYLGLSKDRYSVETFRQYGNCASAAVAVDLCRRLEETPAATVCLATFGVGLSWGFGIINMRDCHIGGIHIYHTPDDKMTRAEKIEHWLSYYKEGNHA